VSLPTNLRVKLGDYVTIDMDTDKPYTHFAEHKKKYPPGQLKKKDKWSQNQTGSISLLGRGDMLPMARPCEIPERSEDIRLADDHAPHLSGMAVRFVNASDETSLTLLDVLC